MGGNGGEGEVALSTCAEQLPSGPGPCAHGEWSTGTVVEGSELVDFEGAAVHLTFINENNLTLKGAATVVDGSFKIDVLQPAPGTCRLGVEMAGGALYVDTDANGECDPEADWLFVWSPQANPGTCQPVAISPTSARCDLRNQLTSQNVLRAAQALCPKVGSCLDFCPDPPPEASGGSQPFCPTEQGGAGGADSMGGGGAGGLGDGGSG